MRLQMTHPMTALEAKPERTESTTHAHHTDHASLSNTSGLYGAIHLPDFPVQALTRQEPALRRKPVVVLDGTFPIFTVVAANASARQKGVTCGMSRLQLEPFSGLHIRLRSPEQEDATHRALLDCAHAFTPRIEDTATDTVTLDLNGLAGLWGTPRPMAQRIFRAAAKLGIEAHVGVGPNPEAAILAARAASGITLLDADNAAQKLAPLPLDILPASEEIASSFQRWGLETFEDLTMLSEVQISERCGQDGVHLQRIARGEATRPLRFLNEKPYFKESIELEHSISSLEPLKFILSRLIHQISDRLASRNRTAGALELTLELEPDTARSPKAPPRTFVRTLRPPLPIRNPKILLKLLQMDLEIHKPPAPIVHVAIEADPVEPRRVQNGLFVPLAPEPEKLELTLARLGHLVGAGNVGSPQLEDTHRPDAFTMVPFRTTGTGAATTVLKHPTSTSLVSPPAGSNLPTTSQTRPSVPHPRAIRQTSGAGRSRPAPPMARRLFRPVQPATVEVHDGQPSRILFGGQSYRVVHARGPWNASGEWWRDLPWNREEWDVEVQADPPKDRNERNRPGQRSSGNWRRALYRLVRDPRRNTWFIDGVYD